MLRTIAALCYLVLAYGCATNPSHKNLNNDELPPLIPVRDFVANTAYNGHYRVSPDGKTLAWKAVAGTREEIFVRPVDSDQTRSLGFGAQGYPFVWAQDSRHLLFIKDAGGNENFHLYRIDTHLEQQTPIDITPLENTRVHIQQLLRDDPEHILIIHNGRNKTIFDLYRINIHTSETQLLYRNEEQIVRIITNQQGKIQARVKQQGDERHLQIPLRDHQDWKTIRSWSQDDDVVAIGFSNDNTKAYLISNQGRDKTALVEMDIQTGNETTVYQRDDVDVRFVQLHPRTRKPTIAYSQPDYPHFEALQADLKPLLEPLKNNAPAGIYISSTDDEQRFLTVDVNDDRIVSYYLLDTLNKTTTWLGSNASIEFADALSTMQPVQFKARDGLLLNGYLTLPATQQRPLPMVLYVHGGPFWRHIWRYDRQAQFLANRGYAVLQVNYRGSSGYGRKFTEASYGEFGGKIQHDLLDAVDWAVAQGIADKEHIAIMGRSFGGYATLLALSQSPEVFACGIDIVGPTELAEVTREFPPYWKPYSYRWHKALGNPDKPDDADKMKTISPLYFADKFERPVLIVQTSNDVRVKQKQSDQMVAALKKAGKQVDYLKIRGEGHRIRHWKNRLTLYRRVEDYLAVCLGGRSSGFDYYQLGSWLF